ncbi:MAG: tetraacyldisaccharide 4'-kinase [Candidatus Krumholzibacteriia bacterium]|jgi:tetraacyldisaccharide 4'-kinase
MKILDWRPRGERLLLSIWGQRSGPLRTNWGHDIWSRIHNKAISSRVAQRNGLENSPLVISVGNLSLGGTGKTPVVIKLAQDLAARNRSGVVLTRGYKSPLAGPLTVSAENHRAGDEARLLASALDPLGWSVVQARSRHRGLAWVMNSSQVPDLIVLEDGHQTARVARHMDILILDHWHVNQSDNGGRLEATTGPVFPWGPWRESATGADRAQYWLCESDSSLPEAGSGGQPVYTFGRKFSLAGANAIGCETPIPSSPMLVSGIARPEKFESGAQDLLAEAALLSVRLADHTPYDAALVIRLSAALRESACHSLVTTTKDWIKLAPLWPAEVPAYTIGLEIVWGQHEALVEQIDKRLGT